MKASPVNEEYIGFGNRCQWLLHGEVASSYIYIYQSYNLEM